MKLRPEAIALSKRIEIDKSAWDAETQVAATALLCELKGARKKYWRTSGGPQRLATYLETFESRLAALKRPGTGMTK